MEPLQRVIADFLAVVENLKGEHELANEIDLPRIIVCGDQSSGKSSLLESVTGMKFPVHEGLCTRFATELNLRTGSGPEHIVEVSIKPDPTRSTEDQARLCQAVPTTISRDISQFGDIVKHAAREMARGKTQNFFSDVLKVTYIAPFLFNLSVVDLPGLFQNEAPGQTLGDASFVKELVREYMRPERTIIIAVMSARASVAVQSITAIAKEVDPEGRRTLGVVTKPDELENHPGDREQYIQVLQNKLHTLGLGWHVVMNRGPQQGDVSILERRQLEAEYLSTDKWQDIKQEYKGAVNLQTRLTRIYHDHITKELPGLLQDIAIKIDQLQVRLASLPIVNNSFIVKETRGILGTQCTPFYNYVYAAVMGNYNDLFFSDRPETHVKTRIVTVLQDFRSQFAAILECLQSERLSGKVSPRATNEDDGHIDYDSLLADTMTQLTLCNQQTPGQFNQAVAGDVVRRLTRDWRHVVQGYLDSILQIISEFMVTLVSHLFQESIAQGTLQYLITPAVEALHRRFEDLVLQDLQVLDAAPIFQSATLLEIPTTRHAEITRAVVAEVMTILSSTNRNTHGGMSMSQADVQSLIAQRIPPEMLGDRLAAVEVVQCAVQYCQDLKAKMEQKINFQTMSQELLSKLPSTLSFKSVSFLDDEDLVHIGGTEDPSTAERQRLHEQCSRLRAATQRLSALAKLGNSADSSLPQPVTQAAQGKSAARDDESETTASDGNGDDGEFSTVPPAQPGPRGEKRANTDLDEAEEPSGSHKRNRRGD
ncbi:hypothetical protein LTR84_007951 [Exophiala bonariae]|uniref:Dynamin-type G domain-containing protein n=1 Tax=Exophiala bonariae TaxID=1690606 RepID=A0AAV9NPA4_9EURO|nr:hypothetical protein LTR84_007951 [Exophiala bonariae]